MTFSRETAAVDGVAVDSAAAGGAGHGVMIACRTPARLICINGRIPVAQARARRVDQVI
ncbi:hypothetical protein [Burkholderia territorii]|uniref:hypothetical protein n=1 Tax=Burkholderia territorii TaxID=1503055 RepID=UPI0012D99FF4|nr:hypothetical protein [Burkholderia territorii]